MASSFAVDPRLYTHPQSLSWHGIRYGEHEDQWLNYYRHPAGGTHWCLVAMHPGGWSSADPTTEAEGSTKRMELFKNYLISTDYPTSSPAIDVAFVRYPMLVRNLANPAVISGSPSPYEETIDGVSGGQGPVSRPGDMVQQIESLQMATQFLRKWSTRFGIDPNHVNGWGMSAGASAVGVSALSPSRHFFPEDWAGGEFDFHHHSRFNCALLWFYPCSLNPWKLHFETTGPAVGITESDTNRVRAQMERLLLVPASDGTYPQDAEETALCKRLSLLSRIEAVASRPELKVPLRSYYWSSETTTAPGATYDMSTFPYPLRGTGHDYRQFQLVADACTSASVSHSGRVLNTADYPGLQQMFESTFAESYEWLVDNG